MADANVSEQLAFDKIKIGLASPEKIRKWATRKVGDKRWFILRKDFRT